MASPQAKRRRRQRQRARKAQNGGQSSRQMVVRNRAPRPRRNRASGPPRMLNMISGVPVAQNAVLSNSGPRFSSVPNGIVVSHTQKLLTLKGSTTGEAFSMAFNPRNLGWIGEVAEHFQHFRVISMNFRYVGRVSTGSGGTVTMAPWYEASRPVSISMGANGFFDFLRDLPGVKEFAIWASDQVGVLAKNFTRTIFRTIGAINTSPVPWNANSSAPNYTEAENPGYILGMVKDDSGGASPGRDSGELWVDYTVELSAARGKGAGFFSIYTESTTDTALALTSSAFLGDPAIAYPVGTNSIKFQRPGYYTVIVKRTGTNPVEASASWLINDYSGEDYTTDRIVDSVQAGVYSGNANASNQALAVGSATAYLTVAVFRIRIGDVLVLPALTSGTITATNIHIIAGGAGMLYES